MTLGQIRFELRATQKRMDGRKDGRMDGRMDGRTDKGKSNCPPLKFGHKKSSKENKMKYANKYIEHRI
jgi:hypothetical protein